MLLKYYALLFLVTFSLLQANSQLAKDGVYESRKNIKNAQNIIDNKKRNLNDMKKTLALINKKNKILKKITKKQKNRLYKVKKDLNKATISLKKEKENLIDIEKMLNEKISVLQQQQQTLNQQFQKITITNKILTTVVQKVNSKEQELKKLRLNISKQQNNLKLKDEIIYSKNIYIVLSVIALILFIILYTYMTKLRNKEKNTSKELKELTKDLEIKIKDGVEKQKMLETQKSSSMNEMIGNIAHQWRQPLNSITATCTHLSIKATIHGKVEVELLLAEMDKINNYAQYLSKTIDTFRDYIKGGKEYMMLVLQDEIDQAIMISSSTLKSYYIELENNIDYDSPIKINLVKSELPQVIINLINNAKDALLQNKTENPKIEINLIKEDDKIIITLEDNAGGIPEEIMHKIFEPYFTTKHNSKGTGLGLNMSYKIITQSLKGEIYAQNTELGAKFFIELPRSSEATS